MKTPTGSVPATPFARDRFTLLLAAVITLALAPTWVQLLGLVDAQRVLAILLVGYLIRRDGPQVVGHEGEPFPEGVLALVVASLLWAAALIMDIGVIHIALAITLPAVWIVTVRGIGVAPKVFQILLTASLVVPFWGSLGLPFRLATAFMSGNLARLLGIEAEIGAFTIALNSGTLRVAGGCGGIQFFLVSLTLAAAYGHLFVPRPWTRLKIVGIAGVAAVFANWVRVTILVVVAEMSEMQSPLMDDHDGLGWVVWTACMVPAFLLARRIEDSDVGGSERASRSDPPEAPDTLPPETVSRGLLVAATFAVLVGPLIVAMTSVRPEPVADVRSAEPLGVHTSWAPSPNPTPWMPAYAGIDASAGWVFDVEGGEIHGARFAFEDQRRGQELVQDGNSLVSGADSLLSERVRQGGRRLVNESIVLRESGPVLVWWWYRVGGAETPFGTRAKLLEVTARLGGAPPSELVVLYAGCEPSDCSAAAHRLELAVDGPGARDGADP